MEKSTVVIILIMGGLFVWVVASKMRERRGLRGVTPVILVRRPIPPASNVLRNIVVLAVVVALGWLFWFGTHGGFKG